MPRRLIMNKFFTILVLFLIFISCSQYTEARYGETLQECTDRYTNSFSITGESLLKPNPYQIPLTSDKKDIVEVRKQSPNKNVVDLVEINLEAKDQNNPIEGILLKFASSVYPLGKNSPKIQEAECMSIEYKFRKPVSPAYWFELLISVTKTEKSQWIETYKDIGNVLYENSNAPEMKACFTYKDNSLRIGDVSKWMNLYNLMWQHRRVFSDQKEVNKAKSDVSKGGL